MPMTPDSLLEPARRVPVIADVDVCVLGGSATGVFAAVRAARRGARVALVEKNGFLGGTATAGLVNVWHSLLDAQGRERIVGGLTHTVSERLLERDAAILHEHNPSRGLTFNPYALALELDRLVLDEPNLHVWLHTAFCAPAPRGDDDDGAVSAVIVENKDGRAALRARVFVDATGDGDLAERIGWPRLREADAPLQPPTACALVRDFDGAGFRALYSRHRGEFGLAEDAGWHGPVPGLPDVSLFAETHVFGVDASDAAQLTRAEFEGRRQLRACLDLLARHGPGGRRPQPAGLCAQLGIRETRRFEGAFRMGADDLLSGRTFPDTVARGTYRVDMHRPEGGGFVFRYLDGREEIHGVDGCRTGRWRDPQTRDPRYYSLPYRMMVHEAYPNVILAGRMISAEREAYGAVRVMVNLNQMGEAAGEAAVLAAMSGEAVASVDARALRAALRSGGSLLPDNDDALSPPDADR